MELVFIFTWLFRGHYEYVSTKVFSPIYYYNYYSIPKSSEALVFLLQFHLVMLFVLIQIGQCRFLFSHEYFWYIHIFVYCRFSSFNVDDFFDVFVPSLNYFFFQYYDHSFYWFYASSHSSASFFLTFILHFYALFLDFFSSIYSTFTCLHLFLISLCNA